MSLYFRLNRFDMVWFWMAKQFSFEPSHFPKLPPSPIHKLQELYKPIRLPWRTVSCLNTNGTSHVARRGRRYQSERHFGGRPPEFSIFSSTSWIFSSWLEQIPLQHNCHGQLKMTLIVKERNDDARKGSMYIGCISRQTLKNHVVMS